MRKVVVKGTTTEERIYFGTYEIYRKTVNQQLDFERLTHHINDDSKKVALTEYKTVENGLSLQEPEVTIRYQYDNHLGSACIELDENAGIVSYEEYHPFGTTSYRSGRSETEVSLKRYKYVGKERDEETGLYYYGMRYYADWLCRFVSVDPLQFKFPHYTPYQYAGNKPITFIDLDGAEEKKTNYPSNENGICLPEVEIVAKGTISGNLVSKSFRPIEASRDNARSPYNKVTLDHYFSPEGQRQLRNAQFWDEIKNGNSGEIGKLISKDSPLPPELKSQIMKYRVDTSSDRFRSNPLGELFYQAFVIGPSLGVASDVMTPLLLRGISPSLSKIYGNTLTKTENSINFAPKAASGGLKIGEEAASEGLTNQQLVQRGATFADGFVPYTKNAGVTGTLKHEAATTLLKRYQNIYGNKGLRFKVRESGSILDVLDDANGMIYDWKFGYQGGKTLLQLNNSSQMIRYQKTFGLPTQVFRP